MRGVDLADVDIDAPWVTEPDATLRINGVDVAPYVEAELNRRFPGRSERHAPDPDGLRAAWAAIEATWEATLERVATMPAGTVEVSVAGEWTFAQTVRHLVMATDSWLGTITPADLDAERRNPHAPEFPETVRHCLHVILEEEWEHHRFAVRDLDLIEARG